MFEREEIESIIYELLNFKPPAGAISRFEIFQNGWNMRDFIHAEPYWAEYYYPKHGIN